MLLISGPLENVCSLPLASRRIRMLRSTHLLLCAATQFMRARARRVHRACVLRPSHLRLRGGCRRWRQAAQPPRQRAELPQHRRPRLRHQRSCPRLPPGCLRRRRPAWEPRRCAKACARRPRRGRWPPRPCRSRRWARRWEATSSSSGALRSHARGRPPMARQGPRGRVADAFPPTRRMAVPAGHGSVPARRREGQRAEAPYSPLFLASTCASAAPLCPPPRDAASRAASPLPLTDEINALPRCAPPPRGAAPRGQAWVPGRRFWGCP